MKFRVLKIPHKANDPKNKVSIDLPAPPNTWLAQEELSHNFGGGISIHLFHCKLQVQNGEVWEDVPVVTAEFQCQLVVPD